MKKINKTAIYLMLLIPFLTGCWPDRIDADYDLEGVLLFEENLGWFTHGYMPEAVAFNPKTQERFVLTRETYGNGRYQWLTRHRAILFESNRKRSSAGPYHLFVLNPANGRIDPFHEGVDMNRMTGGFYNNQKPIVNNHKDEVYYFSRPTNNLMVESIVYGNRREVDFKTGNVVSGRVSNDGKYLLLHDILNFPRGPSRITVLDTNNHNIIFQRVEDNVGFHIGDIFDGNFIFTERRNDLEKRYVILKNLSNNNSDTLMVSDISDVAEIRRPVFGDETYFYYIDRSGENEKIMKMEIDTKETLLIYESRSIINNLDVFRSVQ